jgi:lipopolysaccharide export system protein LptA
MNPAGRRHGRRRQSARAGFGLFLGLLLAASPLVGGPLGPAPAGAQLLGGIESGAADQPIEIDAEEGIEWRRDEKSYLARGNARALRGDLAVYADVLTAHYRELADGSSEIWRLSAEGNVRMTSPTETIFGEHATYDLDQGVVTVTGSNLRVETPDEVLTAKDSLEYWDKEQLIVARGDAVITQEDKKLRADLLTGYLRKTAEGKSELSRVEGTDIEISTPAEFVVADEGVYELDSEIATLLGHVKITRGDNQLNGDQAEVNMKTGVSRLTASGGGRVRTLLSPDTLPKDGQPQAAP